MKHVRLLMAINLQLYIYTATHIHTHTHIFGGGEGRGSNITLFFPVENFVIHKPINQNIINTITRK